MLLWQVTAGGHTPSPHRTQRRAPPGPVSGLSATRLLPSLGWSREHLVTAGAFLGHEWWRWCRWVCWAEPGAAQRPTAKHRPTPSVGSTQVDSPGGEEGREESSRDPTIQFSPWALRVCACPSPELPKPACNVSTEVRGSQEDPREEATRRGAVSLLQTVLAASERPLL